MFIARNQSSPKALPTDPAGNRFLTRIFQAPEVFIGKAFKGAAVVNLLQTLDNEANGHLRERPEGEIFSTYFLKSIRDKVYLR